MVLLADNTSILLVFIAGLGLMIWMLLMRSHRYFQRQRRSPSSAASGARSPSDPRQAPGDTPSALARWEVEMYDIARETSAQLDSKMSALQALIAEADRAAARLETALDRAEDDDPG